MATSEWEGLAAWRIAVCAEEMAVYGSVVVVCTNRWYLYRRAFGNSPEFRYVKEG